MTSKAIIIRYCEIHLKGKNKGFFEKLLKNNIKNTLKDLDVTFTTMHSRYLIENFDDNDYEIIMNKSSFKILRNSYDEVYNKTSEPLYVVGLSSSIKENVNGKINNDSPVILFIIRAIAPSPVILHAVPKLHDPEYHLQQ